MYQRGERPLNAVEREQLDVLLRQAGETVSEATW